MIPIFIKWPNTIVIHAVRKFFPITWTTSKYRENGIFEAKTASKVETEDAGEIVGPNVLNATLLLSLTASLSYMRQGGGGDQIWSIVIGLHVAIARKQKKNSSIHNSHGRPAEEGEGDIKQGLIKLPCERVS